MKITPKQYAQSLYDVVEGKGKKEISEAIKNFVMILASNNAVSKLDKIIGEFGKVWNREQGIVEAEVTSAKMLSGILEKEVENYIREISGAKEVIMTKREDKKLLGGVVIKYGDKVLDGSLRTKLIELKEQMAK